MPWPHQSPPWAVDGSAAGQPVTVEVPPRSTLRLDDDTMGAAFGAVMVEFTGGSGAVSHILSGEGQMDEGPCSRQPVTNAHFPAIDTRRGAEARLWVFNPFPSDVVIEGTVSSSDGTRVPRVLAGAVARAGRATLIDLGEIVQRRGQFSISLEARAGQFIAELAQTGGTESPNGLRLQTGIAAPSDQSVFAFGEVTAGVASRLVLFNPADEPETVVVSIVPFISTPDTLPEPFEIEVPGRRAVDMYLNDEPRVPVDGPFFVRIHAGAGSGVTAQQVFEVTGDNGLGLSGGTATSVAALGSSSQWLAAGLRSGDVAAAQLAVVNPSLSTIAVVSVSAFAQGESLGEPIEVELPPGGGELVDVMPFLAGLPEGVVAAVEISSEEPVVVAKRIRSVSGNGFSVAQAFPAAEAETLPGLADSLPGLSDDTPTPTEPVSDEPVSDEPEPTDPVSTEPESTEPASTDPEPTEPGAQ